MRSDYLFGIYRMAQADCHGPSRRYLRSTVRWEECQKSLDCVEQLRQLPKGMQRRQSRETVVSGIS